MLFWIDSSREPVTYDAKATIRATFVQGLKDEKVKMGLMHLRDDVSKSYEDLRDRAILLEAEYATGNNDKRKVANVTDHDDRIDKLCTVIEKLSSKVISLEEQLEKCEKSEKPVYNKPRGLTCYYCEKRGHKKKDCFAFKKFCRENPNEQNTTNAVGIMHDIPVSGPVIATRAEVNGVPIKCIVDTGAVTSIISRNFVKSLPNVEVKPMSDFGPSTNCNFYAANGEKLHFDGYVTVVLSLDSIADPIDVIFLVMSTKGADHVLLGTNILQFLYDLKDDSKSQLNVAINVAHSLMNKHRFIRAPKHKSKFEANCVTTRVTKLKVKPANFVRQVVLVPTREAQEIPGLKFQCSCLKIPKYDTDVKVPYMVENHVDNDRYIPKHLPLYKVENVMEVIELNRDLQNVVLSDEELLKRCNIDLSKFSDEQQSKILEILLKHKAVFAANNYQLGLLKDYQYEIKVKEEAPQKIRYRPINPKLYDQVQKQLKVMLDIGVITESKSEYSSPAVLVPKPGSNEIRVAQDYRYINKLIVNETKIIPRISDMLSLLGGNAYFSSCDVQSGFLQISLTEASRKYTAFTAGSGQNLEYSRLPFGLKISSSCFQKCMENVLGDLLYKHALVYIDDFLLLGKTFEQHLTSLDLVLSRLKSSGLKLKPEKCSLFKDRLTYLGYEISSDGIRSDPDKLAIIRDWEIPSCTKELKRFLSVLGYFRRSLNSFAMHAAPLTKLLQGKLVRKGNKRKFQYVEFDWGPEQTAAFNKIKEIFLENVCLIYPDYDKDFLLYTDASLKGIGSVLAQEINGRIRPIAFASRKLNKAELGYSVHHLEFLALKWSVTNKFSDYLRHSHCVVYTDNSPLTYILDKVEIDPCTQRWCSQLANYSLTVRYKRGCDNRVADIMSRLKTNEENHTDLVKKWCEGIDDRSKQVDCCVNDTVVKQILQNDVKYPMLEQAIVASIQNDEIDTIEGIDDDIIEKIHFTFGKNKSIDWYELQKKDANIQFAIKHFVDKNTSYAYIKDESNEIKALFKQSKHLRIENGLLYKVSKSQDSSVKQLVINDTVITVLKEAYHDKQSHLGMDRVLKIVQSRFYCYKLNELMRKSINRCIVCAARKSLPECNRTIAYERPISMRPMQNIAIDHLTIDGSEGKTKKILTVTDEMSKMLFIIPVRNEKAQITADALLKLFLTYGIPNKIHSDNGKAFCNKVVEKLLESLDIEHTKTVAYNSRSNAICERQNSVILNMLGCLSTAQKHKWWNYCNLISYAYNTTQCSTGYSPYYLFFGRHPRLIGDVMLGLEFNYEARSVPNIVDNLHRAYQSCVNNLRRNRERYRAIYDKKLPKHIATLEVGDICLMRNERMKNKIDNRWSAESYEVVERLNTDVPVYKVKNLITGKIIVKHRNQLLVLFRSDEITPARYQHKLKPTMDDSDIETKQADEESNESDIDHDSDDDDDTVNHKIVVNQAPEVNRDEIRTRSGRLIRKPQRLGIDLIKEVSLDKDDLNYWLLK